MTTIPTRKPRPAQARTIQVVRRQNAALTIAVKVDGLTTYYRVTPIAADFGAGYTVGKIAGERDGESYDALLADQPGTDSCTCPGSVYGRGRACRHLAVLRALGAAGSLPEAK